MKIVNIVCKAAVTVTLLLTFSASSWGQTSLDNAPVGSQAAARGGTGPRRPCSTGRMPRYHTTQSDVRRGRTGRPAGGAGLGRFGQATMVLLTGSGDNAHVYDQFAFQFTDFFHVIGITRRGFLPSSQPENGYDVETRAADDIAVLDALGIKQGRLCRTFHRRCGIEQDRSKLSQVMSIN